MLRACVTSETPAGMSERDPLLSKPAEEPPSPETDGYHDDHAPPVPVDLRYGCLGYRPAWLQRVNTSRGFVTCLCLCSVIHNTVTLGLPGVVLSTLEKRFGLSSTQSSWIVSAFEVATIPSLVAITILGPRWHRPRVIAGGLILVALGSAVFTLPHFLAPPYRPGALEEPLCRNHTSGAGCEEREEAHPAFFPLFLLGRVMHGLGCTPVYTLGVTYMDDVMDRKRFATVVGVFYGMGVIGTAVGTVGGASVLGIYTDVTQPVGELTPADPRWVGAWWLPFLTVGALCFLIALPMAGFPADLPGAAEIRKNRKSETHGGSSEVTSGVTDDGYDCDKYGGATWRSTWWRICGLLRCAPYLLITLYISCDSIIIGGFTAFGPKFVEKQFNMEASQAGAVAGAVLLPAGVAGTVLGGVVIERLALSCRQILRWELVLTLGVLLGVANTLLSCGEVSFAGVNTPYFNSSVSDNLTAICNADCMCDGLPYSPVCSYDNVRYYSPCHAGCTRAVYGHDVTLYWDCSCITQTSMTVAPEAISGACPSGICAVAAAFFAVYFATTVMFFMCSSMNITASIRMVGVKEKAIAVPLQWIIVRTLGTIPGPIVLGVVFDSACSLWSYTCGSRASCLTYDTRMLGVSVFVMIFSVKLLSAVLLGAGMLTYKPGPVPPDREVLVTADTTGEDASMELEKSGS